MLNKNYEILCKLNLTQNNITVNDIIKAVNYELKNVAVTLIGASINDIQGAILDKFLGTKWNERDDKIAPWMCPHCYERSSFVRRGTRSRKLKTSEGTINFNLHQVTCKSCSKTFSPFPQLLGLKPRVRISTEFEEKIVKLALENSYEKTSKYIESFTESTISHTASRNITLRASDNISIENEIHHFDNILIDGTKVKSGIMERGSEIHLALAPAGTTIKNGRKYNNKTLLAFTLGKSVKVLKKQLSKYSCNNVIVDGDSSYTSVINEVFNKSIHRRCIWHIPRQLGHLLYTNQVPVEDRSAFIQALVYILKLDDYYKAIGEYFSFIKMFEGLKFNNIVTFLKNSMPGIFHSKEDWETIDKHTSNSLIEREMREINRRTDNGCRWSDDGVYRLVKLIEISRHSKHNFDNYFKQNRRPVMNILQVSLCS